MVDRSYGLDIGTMNVRLSSLDIERFISEKNVIAIKNDKYIIGYGNDAYEMYEKAPESVEVIFPVHKGVISDIDKMQLVIEYVFKKINNDKNERGSSFLISIPNDITELEKRAYFELVANSRIKPKSIELINRAIADALACHIDMSSPTGSMIVNIGAATTDISVISMGELVSSRTIKVGGIHIDEQIVSAVKSVHNKVIGMKSAEALKIKLGDLGTFPENNEETIFGRVIATGLPVRMAVPSELINASITEALMPIVEAIKIVVDKTPPELANDIIENGIYLVGGSSNIKNISVMFRREIGIPVVLLKNPENSTIRGLSRVLANPKFEHLKYNPEEKIYR